MTSGIDKDDWVSIAEATRRLNAAGDPLDRSTLSRYLKQHAEALPMRQDGKSYCVEFGALVAHRAANVRLGRSSLPISMPSADRAVQPRHFTGSQSDGAARKAQADAAMREMDLADRRGELTLISEVDKAGRDAIALMQSALDRAIEIEAARAAVKHGWDERIVRVVLKSLARHGLDDFHQEMLKQLDAFARAEMAGDQDDVPLAGGTLQ